MKRINKKICGMIFLIIIIVVFVGSLIYGREQKKIQFSEVYDAYVNKGYEKVIELAYNLQEPYKSYYTDYITYAVELKNWTGTEQELYIWLEDFFEFYEQQGYADIEFPDGVEENVQVWNKVLEAKEEFEQKKEYISDAFLWQPEFNQILKNYYTNIYEVLWKNRELYKTEAVNGYVLIPMSVLYELDAKASDLYNKSEKELVTLQTNYNINSLHNELFENALESIEDAYILYQKNAISLLADKNEPYEGYMFFYEDTATQNYDILSNNYYNHAGYISLTDDLDNFNSNLAISFLESDYLERITPIAYDLHLIIAKIYDVEFKIKDLEKIDEVAIFKEIFGEYDSSSNDNEDIQNDSNNIDENMSNNYEENVINKNGNTYANLLNGGWVTEQGDWNYYAIYGYILKENIITGEKVRVYDFGSESIKVTGLRVIGDWIYFIHEKDGLCRIKTNGTEYEYFKLQGYNLNLVTFKCNWNGYHGDIYDGYAYKILEENITASTYRYFLAKIDWETGVYEKLFEVTDNLKLLGVKDGYVYFEESYDKRNYVYFKVNLDDYSKKQCSFKIKDDLSNPCILNGELIAFSFELVQDTYPSFIEFELIETNFENESMRNRYLSQLRRNISDTGSFNFIENDIIYADEAIMKIDSNGTISTVIVDEPNSNSICVAHGKIYYRYGAKAYVVNPDGTGFKKMDIDEYQ